MLGVREGGCMTAPLESGRAAQAPTGAAQQPETHQTESAMSDSIAAGETSAPSPTALGSRDAAAVGPAHGQDPSISSDDAIAAFERETGWNPDQYGLDQRQGECEVQQTDGPS